MDRASDAVSVGIDFGTSNTVVAVAGPDGDARTVTFGHRDAASSVFATALLFWDEGHGSGRRLQVEGGPFAIDRFLDGQYPHRFVQSFKTFAASPAFQDTRIFRERFRFEDLLSTFLRVLGRHAGGALDLSAERVVVGRPVRFAGRNPDDALATARYRAAFGRLGAGHARFVHEPVGAAFFYARQLRQDATVLVADFGGGTSDFSVVRFAHRGGRTRAEPLGQAGVGIAGDTFDARIVDHVVAPRLGKGGRYRSMGGKLLPLPNGPYASLSRWHQLALMKGSGELKDLRELCRAALDPEPLRLFIDLVENDLGFALYRAVSGAKVALSSEAETLLRFQAPDALIEATVTREAFEGWIAADVARIGTTVDEALATAKVGAGEIDRVFLTGGTSFVPAIRRLFARRFGAHRLTAADPFESIARGLALIGRTEEPERWSVG